MDLFELQNNRIIPSTHALTIEPFKSIWENDTSKHKSEATKILSYVELLCSPKKSNPFAGYSEEDRPKKVKKEIFGDEKPQLEPETISSIMYATLKYRELLANSSQSYILWVSASKALDKIRHFLDTFQLDERSNGGAMVIKPRDITNAINSLPDADRTVQTYRDKIQGELNDSTKTRNQRTIGFFERP